MTYKFEQDLPQELREVMSPMPWDVSSGIVLDADGKMICNVLDNWMNPYDHAYVAGWNNREDEAKKNPSFIDPDARFDCIHCKVRFQISDGHQCDAERKSI